MPTSGTCRPTEPRRAGRRARAGATSPSGFTLLEIVVVLAIMGLVAAIAIPAVVRGVDSWRRQAQAEAVMDQLRGLPARARAAGRPIDLSDAALASATPPLRAEDGWSLAVPSPWRVHANGVCDGGVVELHGDGRVLAVRAAPPFCDPRPVEGDG